LTYAITKENKHISRTNISDDYKSMINPPEVYFGIQREHAELGQKNLIIFGYKKSFGQILQKWKAIFIKRFTT
jgi:hypothetical protein